MTEFESKENRDAAVVRALPPLVFLAGIVVAALTQWIVPLRLPLPATWLRIAGPTLVVLALLLFFWARRQFVASGQDPDPRKPSPELFDSGPYRYSRNPIYVAMFLLAVGLGLWLDNSWMVLAAPIAAWVVQRTAIVPEEAYLEARFGDGYRDYRKRVRRWL